MIDIELKEDCAESFAAWVKEVAPSYTQIDAVLAEAMQTVAESYQLGEDMIYEIGKLHTVSGRPETFRFRKSDLVVTEVEDEE